MHKLNIFCYLILNVGHFSLTKVVKLKVTTDKREVQKNVLISLVQIDDFPLTPEKVYCLFQLSYL